MHWNDRTSPPRGCCPDNLTGSKTPSLTMRRSSRSWKQWSSEMTAISCPDRARSDDQDPGLEDHVWSEITMCNRAALTCSGVRTGKTTGRTMWGHAMRPRGEETTARRRRRVVPVACPIQRARSGHGGPENDSGTMTLRGVQALTARQHPTLAGVGGVVFGEDLGLVLGSERPALGLVRTRAHRPILKGRAGQICSGERQRDQACSRPVREGEVLPEVSHISLTHRGFAALALGYPQVAAIGASATPWNRVFVFPPTQTVPSGSAVIVTSPARPSRRPWETR
jgi:hypothetical protein